MVKRFATEHTFVYEVLLLLFSLKTSIKDSHGLAN